MPRRTPDFKRILAYPGRRDAGLENEKSAAAHAALGFAGVGRIRCFRKALKEHPGGP